MLINRKRFSFILVGALVMVLFNVKYCHEIETAERARFEGWVGTLTPRSLPEALEIEYRAVEGVQRFTLHNEEAKVRAVRLLQVLKEADVVGRVTAGSADRYVAIRAVPDIEYSASFSDEEARVSPQLQVFARLVREFSASPLPSVASAPVSR